MDLCDINEIKALLGRHGFRFSKSLGQNFLIEARVPREIAAASGAGEGTGVLEIGPGIGPLTRELSALADRVFCVELDRSLLPILAETLADRDNVEVVQGDVLKLDLPALVREKLPGLTPLVCANLPYNITTPVLTALLEADCFASVTVMIQREVARRICAGPGTTDYGAFSVFCQYPADARHLFDVPPACFLPAPKVTSSVLRLVPHPAPAGVEDEDRFFQVVRGAFAQRRKTLANSLSASLGLPKEEAERAVLACGLPAGVRGERLGIPEFTRLTKQLRSSL